MNWGNKLLLVFIVFASGMGYLVYRSTQTNFELVEDDYYKSELKYQDVIDGTNQLNSLKSSVSLVQDENGLLLTLPDEMKGKHLTGSVWFYCAYDKSRDRQIKIIVDNDAQQRFQSEDIVPGFYTVKTSWNSEEKNYYSEQKLTVN